MIKSLKACAGLDEAEYRMADLHRGLDSMLTLQEHELRDRVRVVKSYGKIPAIYCYASELNQVFMNLLVNAIQAIEGQEASGASHHLSVSQ